MADESGGGIIARQSRDERSGRVWWWLTGDTDPHWDLLRLCGARFSGKRKAWYWTGAKLPAPIQALVSNQTQEASSSQPDAAPETPVASLDSERSGPARTTEGDAQPPMEINASSVPPPEQAAPPAIRVREPQPFPPEGEPLDAIQSAIRDAKEQTPPTASLHLVSNGRLARIGQTYCGEITGSITGQVFCYGYAVHEGIAVYINIVGPRMAVEAIRAKLGKGEAVSLVPPDAPAIELSAGEGNSGMYHPYLHYLPEARFASLILVHDWAVTPNYGGKSTTFIFRTSDAQAAAKLKHHVTQLVSVPVFDAWSAYLYDAGQRAMLVRKARSAGGIDLLSVELDVDAWTRLLTGGIEQQVISLPEVR